MKFDSINSAIKEIKNKGMVVVLDNEDRENEGDLVMASDAVTSSNINFMAKEGRGLTVSYTHLTLPTNREV